MSYTGRAYDEVNDVIPRSDVRGVEKPYRDDRYDPRYPDSGDYSRPREGERSSRPKYDDDKPYRNNYDSPPYQSDRNPYSEEKGDRKSYSDDRGDRKPYSDDRGDRKPYSDDRGDRKPYSDDRGDRKPYSDDRGDRKPYSDDRGDRKPYPNDSKSDRDPYKDRTSPKRDPYDRKSYPEDKYDRKRPDPEDPYDSRSRPDERYDPRSYPEDPYSRKQQHLEDIYSKPHQGVKPVDTPYSKEKRRSTSPDRHSPYRSDGYPGERPDQKKKPDSTHRSHPDEVRDHSPSHDKKKDKPVHDGYKPLDDLERKLHQPHPDEGLGYDHTRYDHKPHKDIKPVDDPVRGYNDPRYDVSPVTHRDVSPKLHKPISDRLVGDRDVVDYSPRVGVHVSPNPRLIDSPKYDRAPGHESRGPAKYGKPESESVNDLHIHVMPPEVWALNMPDANSQLVSEAIPVGRVRADPSDDLYDARKEIIRQLGHDNIPRDFIFLRTIGTVLTQVTPKQERELKIKHFIPPQTYGSDLYVVDSTALSKQHSGPPTHRMPPLPAIPNSDSHRYRLDDSERKRKDDEDKKRRHEEDKQKRRELDEEKRRRQEDDKRLTYDEIEEKLRLKQRDEEERSRQWKSEENDRLRKRMGERPRTPTPPQRMDTNERESEKDRIVRDLHRLRDRTERADAEKEELLRRARRLQQKNEDRKNHTRDIWKKKYFEEKKRTAPREEHCANLKQEMEGVNRKIIGQMETTKDTGKRDREQKEKADMAIQTTRLEQDIEELQIRLQNIKMKLTAETKLRNQSECELQVLRSELAQKKAKSLGTHNLDPDLGIQTARRPPPAHIRPPTPQYQRDRYDSDREPYDRKSPDSEKENKFHLKMGPVHVETEKPHYDEYRQPERPIEKKEHHEKPVEKKEPDRKESKPIKKDSDSEPKPNKKPDKENPKPRPYNQKEFEEAFHTFATKANGTQATTKDIIKWSTDAGILGKHLNSNHIDIAYFKIKPKESKTIGLKEMHPLIEEMAVKYKEDRSTDHETAKKELLEKFTYAAYKLHGTTNAVKTGGVDRLTDTKKYTGSHKERFDANGKGKGKAGRENIVENSGYVGGFKNKGTYDKTH